ncbi:MAG: sugar phosphate isomerase/epimerase family protein [Candidatus Sumerlaeota bacterium]
MAKPIALQLFTLREQAREDFFGTLQTVADIGYKGVEPAGFFDNDPAEVRKAVEDMGMTICSNHGPWLSPDNVNEVIDVLSDLGLDTAVCGFGPDHFTDTEAIMSTVEQVKKMQSQLKKQGFKLAIHNHFWEFELLDGMFKYDYVMEQCPELLSELDVYWAANFGANDPVKKVRRYADKMPLMHLKDGDLGEDKMMKALGSGKLDIPAIIGAANNDVLDWIIVELDRCEGDMVEAVRESYAYMTGEGLAKGNK